MTRGRRGHRGAAVRARAGGGPARGTQRAAQADAMDASLAPKCRLGADETKEPALR